MRPPSWGAFISYADWDLLSFAWLYEGGLRVPSYYHANQAVEKYLKALILSAMETSEVAATTRERWFLSHNLKNLSARGLSNFSYYQESATLGNLQRFAEFDQSARYPWVEREFGNGFQSTDVPLLCELIRHLRTDIPIVVDDYVLGMALRGHHHGHPNSLNDAAPDTEKSVVALRRVFPDVDRIVRR